MLLHPPVSLWIEAFNAHDVAAIVALYADNAELFDAGMKYPRHGRDEIQRWFSHRFQTMPSITYIPDREMFTETHQGEEQATEQTQAAVTWIVQGRSPRLLGQAWLSRPFKVAGVSVFTLHNGLIQAQRGYYDHLSIIEQILPPLKWFISASRV